MCCRYWSDVLTLCCYYYTTTATATATATTTTTTTTIYSHYTGQPAPQVKNWGILLEQSFTATVPLLMATSTFAGVLLNGVTCTVSIPSRLHTISLSPAVSCTWCCEWVFIVLPVYAASGNLLMCYNSSIIVNSEDTVSWATFGLL